jgi:hypothetical protein
VGLVCARRLNATRHLAIQCQHGPVQLDDHDRPRLLHAKLDARQNSDGRQLVHASAPAFHPSHDDALTGAEREKMLGHCSASAVVALRRRTRFVSNVSSFDSLGNS